MDFRESIPVPVAEGIVNVRGRVVLGGNIQEKGPRIQAESGTPILR
jgi:hypothetical protein